MLTSRILSELSYNRLLSHEMKQAIIAKCPPNISASSAHVIVRIAGEPVPRLEPALFGSLISLKHYVREFPERKEALRRLMPKILEKKQKELAHLWKASWIRILE